MSKIIDANKVQRKLLEECQNIRHFDKDRKKSQIFADGLDFAWVMLDNAPTVDAIPIEWINSYTTGLIFSDDYVDNADSIDDYIYCIKEMVRDWEKENGKDL